jgi:hypothetical protein
LPSAHHPGVRKIRSYARVAHVGDGGGGGGLVTHSTDTGNGMLVEHVSFDGSASLSKASAQPVADPSWLYTTERDAFRMCAEAHYQQPPAHPIKVHIPWTANDYQVDVANASEVGEYMRILTQVQRIGATHILYAASNSAETSVANNTDDWGWETALWINEGQHLRLGIWQPGMHIPDSIGEIFDLAASLNVHMMPYVYPILGLGAEQSGSDAWLFPADKGYHARLANRAFQDYLINLTLDFAAVTGVGGAGYDYTFFQDNNATSFAQWWGWRRIMSTVRSLYVASSNDESPYVVDNRQLNHMWSPWMWTAGSYAEPLQTDEGPYSWNAYILDPHTDRQSANRNRQMNYDYVQSKLCNPSAVPGFLNHQSDRFTSDGAMP